MDATVLKYLRTRATIRPVSWARRIPENVRSAVVVPAYAESETLPQTLDSLANCATGGGADCTAVIVIVNNPALPPALHAAFEDNQATLRWLERHAPAHPLHLGWIDASSPGCELPGRGGVGMARRIGCDTALSLLSECASGSSERTHDRGGRVILNLDADTSVEPTYLNAAEELLESGAGGGAILFEHQSAATHAEQYAIDCYELYIHHYVLGLRLAESPYAFHTVGSTMAATADAYAKSGGMPRKRLAGEDFYFMQNLARTCGVTTLKRTVVHPSARQSQRVPFGTGPRVAAYLDGSDPEFTVHQPHVFDRLRETRQAACRTLLDEQAAAKTHVASIHPGARQFLIENGFEDIVATFRRQYGQPAQRIRAFDTWFDGLATFRLVRHLAETAFPPMPLMDGWRALLQRVGLTLPVDSPERLLQAWRLHLRTS